MIRYKCLVLDHDDTVVMSTKEVHYPAFLEMLVLLRPNIHISQEEFIAYNFNIGFQKLCYDVLRLDEEEMKIEYDIWKKHTRNTIPKPFPGMKELLIKYKNQGGIIIVSSHSESFEIKRDYRENFGFEPDMIFGWDIEAELRKPNPYCLDSIMHYYHLTNNDVLMVDDAKSGYLMCKERNVRFVGNCYYDSSPEIKLFLKKNADFTIESVAELYPIIFKQQTKEKQNEKINY